MNRALPVLLADIYGSIGTSSPAAYDTLRAYFADTHTGPADYVRVANNIVYDNTHGISETGEIGANNTYTDNLSARSVNRNLHLFSKHTGDLAVDPLFVNYNRNGGGDYRLQSSSPALGRGYNPAATN